VNVKALLLPIHHGINTTLILRQCRLRFGRIEPVRSKYHVDAACPAVSWRFYEGRRQGTCKTTGAVEQIY